MVLRPWVTGTRRKRAPKSSTAVPGCFGQAVDVDARAGGVAVDLAEGVLEDALEDVGGVVVGVKGEAGGEVAVEAQGAEVVHAEDVVGVAVGIEHGVEVAEVLADRLGVEVGTGVDQDVVSGGVRPGRDLAWGGGRRS